MYFPGMEVSPHHSSEGCPCLEDNNLGRGPEDSLSISIYRAAYKTLGKFMCFFCVKWRDRRLSQCHTLSWLPLPPLCPHQGSIRQCLGNLEIKDRTGVGGQVGLSTSTVYSWIILGSLAFIY